MNSKNQNTTEEKTWDKEKVLQDIMENYRRLEKSIVKQLFFTMYNHGPTLGALREDIWKSLFEQIVPKKFKVERSVFIIDSEFCGSFEEKSTKNSKSGISNEVDIAIFDESYTPYIFQFGRIKFIPIEAVAAVVECKSTSRDKEKLKDWTDSIKNLNTNSDSIARLAQPIFVEPAITQKATRPIIINCYLEKDDENIGSSTKIDEIDRLFDIVIKANEKEKKISIKFPNQKALGEWFVNLNLVSKSLEEIDFKDYLNLRDKSDDEICSRCRETMGRKIQDYTVKYLDGDEISLLSFNFMFNQLLMLINNPILFPHKAYVEMFNKVRKPKEEGSEKKTNE